MRFAGIDIASESHVLAVINAEGAVEVKATPFGEDAAGYAKALALLGEPRELLIAMEATGKPLDRDHGISWLPRNPSPPRHKRL